MRQLLLDLKKEYEDAIAKGEGSPTWLDHCKQRIVDIDSKLGLKDKLTHEEAQQLALEAWIACPDVPMNARLCEAFTNILLKYDGSL